MYEEGYQIPDLEKIDNLINIYNTEELTNILLKLINKINIDILRDNLSFKLELIEYQYISSYPYIGLKYIKDCEEEFKEYVIEKVNSYLKDFLL